jgi:hypothetical protein
MKRFLYILSAALLAACSGTIDPEDQNQQQPEVEIPDEFTAPFTLSVDKAEVEADGQDCVTFSLKDAYDREMLEDKKTLQSINITSDKGTRVPRMTTSATFISNGEYTFTATFKGIKSANTVVVTARNRAKYEVYHRNVGLFKCTSVSCVACPNLGKILNGLTGEAAEHTVVLAVHGNFSGRDPFSMYVGDTDLGSYMISYFGGSGWPTLIYDLDKAETGSGQGSLIEANIMQRRIDHPATCGIKVESVQLEGSALKVKASMKSSTGGDYDLACAVLRDGLEYQGGYSDNDDGIYNHVVVAASESFIAYYNGQEVAEGAEISEEFSFDFGDDVPSAAVLKDYYVAVYAHRRTGKGSTMDNIVTCAYGDSVDYHLND